MLAGCALLALAALCWLALIEPALARAERARAELTRLRGLSIELETLLASAPREQTARGPATEASLRLGLEQAGLQADVTAPGQDGRWRLSLDDARAEPLLRWLLTQPGRLSLRPDRIDLRRIDAPAAAGSRPAVTVLEVPGKGAVSPTGMSLLDQYRASIELSPPPGTRGNTVTQYRLPQAARTTARRKVVSMAVLAALAGCSTPDGGRRADAPQTGLDGLPPLAMTLAPTAQARATPAPEAARAQPLRTAQASRAVGGDKRAAPLSAQADAGQKTSDTPAANVPPGKPAAAAQEGVLLNFVDADIPAVLRVLAKFTGKQFLVDPRVKGTLTLVSQGPVAPDAAYGMLLGALRMQGYAAVDVAGGTRVMPEADAKLQGGPVQSADAPAGGGVVTRTFRLSYENATALVPVLRPMIAPSNSITAYPANNTLVITDYADNLDRIGRIIASIDNPSSLVTEVVKVRQGIAVDIAGMASELLDAQRNEDPSQRVVVVADPRANSVIVRSGSPGRAKLARDLIRQLDSSQTDPDNLHVVYLRNAQATHLARVLRGVLTGESDGGGAGGDAAARAALGPGGAFGGGLGNSSGNANGQQANTSGASASGAGQNNGTGAGARSGYNGRGTDALGPGTTGRKGQDGSAFSANGVTVNADATTNTLIISAPEPMYRSLRKVIDLLDQRRAQVLVESLIVEITENDGAELGIQWLAGGGRVFGGANFGKDTFTPGGKNSIRPCPRAA